MLEKILKWASGINNLKGVFYGRLLIGLIFIFYGIIVLKENLALAVSFFALASAFTFDGLGVLREYFREEKQNGRKKK